MKSIFLLLFLLILGLTVFGLGWHYKSAIKVVADTLISPYKPVFVKFLPTPKPSVLSDWENINIPAYGLNLKMPPGWVFDKETMEIKSTSNKNSVALSKNSGVLISSIFNQDLFRKIYNLNEGGEFSEDYFSDEIKFKKIESGKILSGQPYVIFVWDYINGQNGGHTVQIKAFILKESTLFILTANDPGSENIEFLKSIMKFSSLTL